MTGLRIARSETDVPGGGLLPPGMFFWDPPLNRRVFSGMLVACSATTVAAGSLSGMSRRRGHQVAVAGAECHFRLKTVPQCFVAIAGDGQRRRETGTGGIVRE